MLRFSRGRCRLQFILDEQGLTPAEFARRSGWSSRMVYHWCSNERTMSVDAMYAASVILQVRMEDLYDWLITEN